MADYGHAASEGNNIYIKGRIGVTIFVQRL